MAKVSISITIDEDVLKDVEKYQKLENRGGRSNYLETAAIVAIKKSKKAHANKGGK